MKAFNTPAGNQKCTTLFASLYYLLAVATTSLQNWGSKPLPAINIFGAPVLDINQIARQSLFHGAFQALF